MIKLDTKLRKVMEQGIDTYLDMVKNSDTLIDIDSLLEYIMCELKKYAELHEKEDIITASEAMGLYNGIKFAMCINKKIRNL